MGRKPKVPYKPLELIEASHAYLAAEARLDRLMREQLPTGSRVIVNGTWRGTIVAYGLPFDGTLAVLADDVKEVGYPPLLPTDKWYHVPLTSMKVI